MTRALTNIVAALIVTGFIGVMWIAENGWRMP